MTNNASKHLSPRQLRALSALGNCFAPGEGKLLSFSQYQCANEVDRILDFMPRKDRGDLLLLLSILAFFPNFLVSTFVWAIEWGAKTPGPMGAPLRFVRLGIRGLITTLYYSHPKVHEALGYQVNVFIGDPK